MSLGAGLPHGRSGDPDTPTYFPGLGPHSRQHHLTRTSHTLLLQQTRFSYCLHVVGDLRKAAMLSAGLQSLKVKPVETAVQ